MTEVANDPNVTDWITAAAAVFAAVGTVGAAVVALSQIARTQKRKLAAECRSAIVLDGAQNVAVLTLHFYVSGGCATRPLSGLGR